jgi:hypothetical protein
LDKAVIYFKDSEKPETFLAFFVFIFMKSINKIIKEEIIKYLRESDEDIDWDLYEKLDDVKRDILSGFLYDKKRGVKKQPWKVIPFPRLRKIWEDFMRTGIVRDTAGLEMIEDIIQTNILKLYVNTELSGHSEVDPDDDFEEYGYTEQDKENFWDYVHEISDYAWSDFGGRRLGLTTLLNNMRRARTPEEKVPIIDQILNVVHQRSDLAALFVEGGSAALSQLSGSPAEVQ